MSDFSDEEILLLCRTQDGFEKGYRMLVKKYKSRIYWHIRRLIIDHDDTNDVTQDVFVKIWRYLPNFREDAALFSWIYRIATNESLNFIRKSKKSFFVPLESTEHFLETQFDYSSALTGDEIALKLEKAIIKLPEKQRLVFNMRYFDELSYQQISDVLKVSVGSLKASYHHAHKKLEVFLEKD